MIGKGVATAGLALSLLGCGASAQAAGLSHKADVGMTCQHTTLIGYQGIIITADAVVFVPGQSFVGTYAVNGKNPFTAAADASGLWAFAVKDGVNVVTETVSGVEVASCSIKISGAIKP